MLPSKLLGTLSSTESRLRNFVAWVELCSASSAEKNCVADGSETYKRIAMSNVVRIVLGAVVLIGTFLTQRKASLAIEDGGVASVFGQQMSPSSLNMVLAVFAILGIVFLVLGIAGLIKANK